jgi:predicted lipoprotein with Yx(FWY)xxD motif
MNRMLPAAASTALWLAAALVAGCAVIAPPPAKAVDDALVGPNGMTLYTFDRDEAGAGKSACTGQCAANWPPLFASDPAAKVGEPWSVVTRDDGTKQWAYRGKPLYFWTRDQKPGERNGDGFNGAWRLARP